MDVCVRLFCVGSGLATGRSAVQGVLKNVYRINKVKSSQVSIKGCRAIDRWESEKEKRKWGEVVRDITSRGRRNFLLISGFESSQAVPACPSGRSMFERGCSFRKQIGTRREGVKPGLYCVRSELTFI
jgi:hypothetical protein